MKKTCEDQLEEIKEFEHDEPTTYYVTCSNFYKGELDKINDLIDDIYNKITQPLQLPMDWFMFKGTGTSKTHKDGENKNKEFFEFMWEV